MSFDQQMDVTPAPLEFDKLNEQGMAKGIPSSMIYQVYVQEGLPGLSKFVGEYDGKRKYSQYLDQHHQE